MKILYGNVPPLAAFDPGAEGLHAIHGPGKSASLWIGTLSGFLLIVPLGLVCLLLSFFAIPGPPRPDQAAPWSAVVLAIVCYIPLHELLHLVWHPRFGASDQSFLILWPAKLQFGVYYEGCMPRARWLLMRLAPLLLLSFLPAALWGVFRYVAFTDAVRTFLEVMMLLNCAGSGADVAACIIVIRQVPRSAFLCFRGGHAYWSSQPEPQSTSPASARP